MTMVFLAVVFVIACGAFVGNVSAFHNGANHGPFIFPTICGNGALSSSTTRLEMATWSNGQAIQEYQDFLASGKSQVDMEQDGPSVIVAPSSSGFNRLVDGLVALGNGDDIVVRAGLPLPAKVGGKAAFPIYIAIPPFELEEFLNTLPDDWKAKMSDFVFFSGGRYCGCIEPILKTKGLTRDSMTQVLASGFTLPGGPQGKPQDVSVKLGLDSNGEDKWAGETAACGTWQGAIAERLERNGIRCMIGFYREWRRAMWERAAYDAVFNLVGAVRQEPTSMRDVANYYGEEVSEMLWEISSMLRGGLAVTLTYGFEERLFGIGESAMAADEPCQVSDEMYPYMFDNILSRSKTVAQYLNYAKDELGLLSNTNVPKIAGDRPSIMRQGNLRSDGVI